jgi:oxygen-independent coproporphyrinogen-3 oxidase
MDAAGLIDDLPRLEPMVRDGLVRVNGAQVQVTERGRPFLRSVAAVFDRYLAQNQARHSIAV